MSRAKLFITNFLSFGLVSTLNKAIPLIFIPIIAYLLPDASDFGVFDMYSVLLNFGTIIAVFGTTHGFFREYFERDDPEYKHNVAQTCRQFIWFSSSIFCLVALLCQRQLAFLFFGDVSYSYVIVLCAVSILLEANRNLVFLPLRILNQRKNLLKISLFNVLSQKILTVVLILLGYHYFGFIYANMFASLLVLVILSIHFREFFRWGHFDRKILLTIFKFSLPLIPITLIHWVYHSTDRIMILKLLDDFSLVGIYSIGSKVASVSVLLQTAFSTGWLYFIYSTMRDSDRQSMLGNLFSLMFCACTSFYLVGFLCKDMIFNLLFSGDYVQGVIVFPYLFLSPLLAIFIYILDAPFMMDKKTIYSLVTLSIGGVVNILLNLLLIPLYSIKGAAIATICGYLTTMIVQLVIVVLIKHTIIIPLKTYLVIAIFVALFIYINLTEISAVTIILVLGYLSLMLGMYGKRFKNLLQASDLNNS